MSGIALDASKVNSYVLPKLDKTNSTMQEAYSASLSLKSSLPGSFSYRGMVSDISAQITEVRKEVTQVKKVVTSKVELAKRIESKSESKIASLVGSAGKIGSIIGSAAGAIKGGAAGSLLGPLGAAAGAVTGAIAGGVTGTLMGKTGAKVAAKTVSGVKRVGSWLWNGIKNVGAKVVKGVKSIAGKVVSGAKKIGNAVKTVAKKTWTAVKNTGAKIVNGVTKAAKGIWNGIKSVGSTIWNGCKKVVKKVTSFVEEKALPWIKNVASKVWDGIKWVVKQIVRTAASIVNFAVSLVEGIVSFVEAIGDFVLLVVGAVCTVFTFLSDVIQGIATGEWKWSATGAVWKKWIMPWVGYDWTSKAFEWQGKWIINDWAYKPFKRGEIVAKIGKGVGYVTGVVALTIVTFGVGSAPTALTTTVSTATNISASTVIQIGSGVVAGTGALGKNTQSGYHDRIDVKTEETYVSEIMKNNPGISKEQAKEYFKYAKENNLISDYDERRTKIQQNLNLGDIGRVLGNSTIQAGIEGTTFALTYGNGLKSFGLDASAGTANEAIKEAAKNTFFGKHKKIEMLTKAGVQASKAFATDGVESLTIGKEFDLEETTQSAIVNAGTSLVYDATVSKLLKPAMENFQKNHGIKEVLDEALDGGSGEGAFETSVSSIMRVTNKALSTGAEIMTNSKTYGDMVKRTIKEFTNEGIDKIQDKLAEGDNL